MITEWKPLTKSEYIIWKVETLEQLETEFPDYDNETINNYFNAIQSRLKSQVERIGSTFTDFQED